MGTERASPVYVDYKLVVTVRRGAFKVNQMYVTLERFDGLVALTPRRGPGCQPHREHLLHTVIPRGAAFAAASSSVQFRCFARGPVWRSARLEGPPTCAVYWYLVWPADGHPGMHSEWLRE